MIALDEMVGLSNIEQSQIDRLEMAKGCWREGRYEDCLLLVGTVLAENLTPRISVRAWIQRATFQNERGEHEAALESLKQAASDLDSASTYIQGTYFSERGRAHKGLGSFDHALTDYPGAKHCFEQIGHWEYVATIEKNTAGVYLKLGEFAQAHEHVDEAIRIFSELKSETLCQAYDTQAEIFLFEGYLALAASANRKAINLCPDNESWLCSFNTLKKRIDAADRIEENALNMIGVATVPDLERVKVNMARRALVKEKGSVTRAGKLLGLDHRGIDRIIERHPEIEECRSKKHNRKFQKALIKN